MKRGTLQKIRSILRSAESGPNDSYTALILIRELCDALLSEAEPSKLLPPNFKSMPFHGRTRESQVNFARARRKEGYSIRQTMKLMNFKSPSSVQKLLESQKGKER